MALKEQKVKTTVLSLTSFLIFIGILITVNIISHFIFTRFDLTRNQIYSLSKFSKKIVRSLEDPIVIKAYFSNNLPQPYKSYREYLKQLLDEYEIYAKGNISVDFVSYDDPKKFEQEAQRQGIPPLRFDQVEHDKYEVQVAYMGLTINYIDKREVIPIVRSAEGLEYDITSRIRRLVAGEKTTFGMVVGNDELDPFDNQEDFSTVIQRDYEIKRIDLTRSTTVPADVDCLLMIRPRETLSDYTLYAIDQYIMSGKPVGFFVSSYEADLQAFRASPITTGVEKLVEHYGVSFEKGVVVDPQCQRIAVSQRQGIFSIQNIVDFMYVPRVVDIASDNPMV
ncbi:MAG: hypothetical protein GF384_07200, partial [Elusimicrobia bacterium]|nr:hypothetical protein [Elusimicrobiota bacterium]MBD3412457.1 hypothetical protein [Elusimicrobiota bacterium]